MKRFLLIITLGILGFVALKSMAHVDKSIRISDEDDKNFGAFPPEIPSAQFDDLFV
ncbi:MAG: hypothetical protein WEB37_09795 [Bacteroidota bacterium]